MRMVKRVLQPIVNALIGGSVRSFAPAILNLVNIGLEDADVRVVTVLILIVFASPLVENVMLTYARVMLKISIDCIHHDHSKDMMKLVCKNRMLQNMKPKVIVIKFIENCNICIYYMWIWTFRFGKNM